jgi:hypothetical protein
VGSRPVWRKAARGEKIRLDARYFRVNYPKDLTLFGLDAGESDGAHYRLGTFDRGFAAVLMDVRFVSEFRRLESDAGFFGGVPSYVVQDAGAGCYAVE